MKILVLVLICTGFVQLHSQSAQVSLEQLRAKFHEAAKSSDAADEFSDMVETLTEQHPLHFGYRGMADMLQAQFSYNPYNKLKYFRRGKEKLERAIALAPHNVELRFLRFAVQVKSPSLLGYKDHIEEDKKCLLQFVDAQRIKLSDKDLLQRIVNFMKSSECCTDSERKRVTASD